MPSQPNKFIVFESESISELEVDDTNITKHKLATKDEDWYYYSTDPIKIGDNIFVLGFNHLLEFNLKTNQAITHPD